jgi:hypothetical protein
MHAHADEILCSGFLVEAHEIIRIEITGIPRGDNVFKAEFGGMAVVSNVVLVLFGALNVYIARIPVASLGCGLGSPVGPNAELGIAKPSRHLIFFE